jgi:hypothetical protein
VIGDAFSERLFDRVLIEPAARGATELWAVAGYSSPSMVVRHFHELGKISKHVSLDLQIGMTSKDGLASSSLSGFRSLKTQVSAGKLNCRVNVGPPNHSKIYVWCNEDGPQEAYLGSANYTQTGFGVGSASVEQIETCVQVEPLAAFDLIVEMSGRTLDVHDSRVEDQLSVFAGDQIPAPDAGNESRNPVSPPLEFVVLPLVQTAVSPGQVHNAGAGLNWGQRGERNRNEAYIPIPAAVKRTRFFPDKGVRFQVLTDDGESFIATVAQQGEKAIETPEDNSLIGAYFRRKMRLMPGEFVTTEHLENYGSNGAMFIKISEDVYRLVFEPGQRYPV